MSELPSILIDPYVLCLSSYEGGDGGFDSFVGKVTAWSELTGRSDIEILFSEECLLGMYEDGCYPEEHKIRSFCRASLQEHVDEQTLCFIVQSVLGSTPTLECRSGIKTVLFDEQSCQIDPCVILERLQEKTQESFNHCLNLFSFWNMFTNIEHVVGTSYDGFAEDFNGRLSVNSTIDDAEYYDVDKYRIDFPVKLESEHHTCKCFDDILEQADILDLWSNARDHQAVTDAINKQIMLLVKAGVTDNRSAYVLGAKLLNSLRRWNFDKRADWARNFVGSCARIILDLPKNTLTKFKKKTASGKLEDLVRDSDGAKAYRTHITKRSEGFRLMLWILPDGTVEFANIGDKDELAIYD